MAEAIDGAAGSSGGAGDAGDVMDAAEANRRFYAAHAAAYDHSEHCAHATEPRELLDGLLARAIAAAPSDRPRTLDACGGTGNASELLAARGIETTIVDVSPEMLAKWRAKASGLGVAADAVEAEIDAFLGSDERTWELIVLSSALHHLDDPDEVLRLACARLAPGGVLVTAFDPIRDADGSTLRLRRVDYIASLLLEPSAFIRALGRRRERRTEGGGVNVGDLAEKHALEGLDDRHLIDVLASCDAEIVEHRRYAYTRLRPISAIFRAMRRSTTFHLIARMSSGQSATSTSST